MCIFLASCMERQLTEAQIYNQNANDLIFQTLEKNNCNCLLEIPKESMIEISAIENPSYDIRTVLKKQLNLNSELDTLVNISKNFQLDIERIKKNNIQIITLTNILNMKKEKNYSILEMCPNSIISIQKPIFDKSCKKAVFGYNYVFTSAEILPYPVYELKNGKWDYFKK